MPDSLHATTATGAPPTDTERLARRKLSRSRAFATSLLVLMAGLIALAYAIPRGLAAEALAAAAKAGLIGGLADWFAVTALFHRPLGLPIPHTAILPRQKERLGRALGRFVANYVITGDEVSRLVVQLDVPSIIRRFLSDSASAHPAAEALAGLMPRVLASVEDGRARRLAARLIPRLIGGPEAGRVVARALSGLVASGRHQDVLTFLLSELKSALAGREEAIRLAVEERVREQGGRLVGWAIGASIARRVLATVNAELDRMGSNDDERGAELRAAFDEWVRREIDRMEEDPARAAEIGHAVRRVVAHETVQGWMWDVWSRLRLALERDVAGGQSRTIQVAEGILANIGEIMDQDPRARATVQRWSENLVSSLLPAARVNLSEFIANVVASWDTATITERLELRVGKDLQFVRVNGTLVGFLAGGALFFLLRALIPGVAP